MIQFIDRQGGFTLGQDYKIVHNQHTFSKEVVHPLPAHPPMPHFASRSLNLPGHVSFLELLSPTQNPLPFHRSGFLPYRRKSESRARTSMRAHPE